MTQLTRKFARYLLKKTKPKTRPLTRVEKEAIMQRARDRFVSGQAPYLQIQIID